MSLKVGHNSLFFSSGFSSLKLTGSSEDGKNVSETEIVVPGLGKLLLAKFVKGVELLGEWSVFLISDRGELDRHDDLSVWNHHAHTSEEDLKVFWQLLSSSITWVHGNEVSARQNKVDWLLFSWEQEFLQVLFLGLSDRLNLSSNDGKGSKRNSVELIEASPKSRLTDTLENLGHISVSVLIRAVGDDDINTKGSSQILDSLSLSSSGWSSWSSSIKHT